MPQPRVGAVEQRLCNCAAWLVPIGDGHSVENAEHQEEGPREYDAGHQQVPRPPVAAHLAEQERARVTADACRHCVQHDLRRVQ